MKQTVNVSVDRGDRYLGEHHTTPDGMIGKFVCPVTGAEFIYSDRSKEDAARASQIRHTREVCQRAKRFILQDLDARIEAIEQTLGIST